MAETARPGQAPLDDLMMAMDVVDTLRHDDALVQRELGRDLSDAALITRLREIYASQGITVPDHILEQGVAGLKQDRFVYAPPAAGVSRLLALAYIRRGRIARVGGIAVAIVVAAVVGWQTLVVAPRERAAAALAQELSTVLPGDVGRLTAAIAAVSNDPQALTQSATLAADANRAIAARDIAAARKAVADLAALEAELNSRFEVRIVSRPGTPTGVTRIPDVNRSTRNFYLVVEAIGPDGSPIERTITSEEDRKAKTVTMWAQRVPEAVFNRVRDDKANDGIVQNARLGTKQRGRLAIDWAMKVEDGAITSW
ncbi:DUF6384 family protein [Pannonibacter tanglangensis]|uniref:Uncharacterized protein n=1 Tax=Pannonibacter tanglangensis TaxID=2750084 RepID=A0ABW9ZKI9_9HYPH|nr:DUF6384 family protein [Pannonibacter sp. XCT-34]NBN63557.1 hypothetical protein [Pannonibacter sp. XCT-34]